MRDRPTQSGVHSRQTRVQTGRPTNLENVYCSVALLIRVCCVRRFDLRGAIFESFGENFQIIFPPFSYSFR